MLFLAGLALGFAAGALVILGYGAHRRRPAVLQPTAPAGVEALNAFPEPLALTEGARIVFANSAFARELPELARQGTWSGWLGCCFDAPNDAAPPPDRAARLGLRGDLQLRTKRGALLHWTAVPFPGYGRKLVLNIVRDVTQWATRDYDNALFMNRAAHELKTPVTAIKGYAELTQLLVRGGRPVSPDIADRIVEQSNRLTHLVNQLLDVARIGAGRLADEPEALDLGAALDDALERLRASFPERRILAEVGARPTLLLDRSRFEQIVREFVMNAVKYSREDSPVTVRLGQDGDLVVLEVEDQGIGIAAADQARIYDRFVRGANAGELPGAGGFGLGLFIARAIVERWHGEIALESDLGHGTRVRAQWPARRPPHAAPLAFDEGRPEARPAPRPRT